jgi:hypothetical protein
MSSRRRMASGPMRQKSFKNIHAVVLGKDEVELELNGLEYKYFLPLYVKPHKLAKELRKIAKWLEKQ